MSKLRSAIIGCGSIAPLHAQSLKALDKSVLVAVADVEPDRARAFGEKYECHFTTDYREILQRADVDVVHVCTPHHLHFEMARDALNANKHVLVEKPLALSVSEAEELVNLASEKSLQLGVVFQNRYNESSRVIKAYIEESKLGGVLGIRAMLTWHRDKAYYESGSWRGTWAGEGGGLLINQAIHTVDLMRWFGGPLKKTYSSISTTVLTGIIEVEDTAHIVMEFQNGARGVFFGTNAYVSDSPIFIQVDFERGSLIQRNEEVYLKTDGNGESLICEAPSQPRIGKSYWGIGHSRCIDDFYTCIAEGKPFSIGGMEAIKTLEILSEVYSSK